MRGSSIRPAIAGFFAFCLGGAGAWGEETPRTLADLVRLEKRVQAVVKKALPATVTLTSEASGSSGSGVVVSREGLILTAGHVVRSPRGEMLDEVTVVFPDGKQVRGRVLGANLSKDAAMVQI